MALDHAHKHGIVHRDIKPGNIMIEPGGRIRVMDFGLVRNVVSDTDSSLSSGVVGTPSYMAPERYSAGDADHRSDIYALGVVLYELVSKRKPFSGSVMPELIKQVLYDEPVPLELLAPRVSKSYAQLTLECLAKEPEQRPKTEDLLRALRAELAESDTTTRH